MDQEKKTRALLSHASLFINKRKYEFFALARLIVNTTIVHHVPAERDVDGQLVDLSLVREAFAGEGKKLQPLIVGEHRLLDAHKASLQADKSLG